MFSKDKKGPDGYRYACKLCDRERQREHYQENREKIIARKRNYREENSEQMRINWSSNAKKYRERRRGEEVYVLRQLLKGAKARAKAKGLPFDLTMEWLETMVISHCPITLEPIDWTRDQVVAGKPGQNSPSIDKNKPELGYVQANCAIVSFRGNTIKNNGTIDEHRRVVQYMAAQQLRDTEF